MSFNLKDAFLGFIGRIAPALLSMSRPARVQRPILQTVEPKNRVLMPYERPRLRPLVRTEPEGRPQRTLRLRERREVQEVLRRVA